MVQRVPEALVEVRRAWSCLLQVDGPDILRSIQLDVPSRAFRRGLMVDIVTNGA